MESRASFSAVVEGPRAPTPDSFPDSFPALGDAEEELDGEVNAYGETVSTLGAHHEPPVSTTDGEDDGSDSRFYDTRVRGYEQTVYEDTEDDGSDSIDPNNPVINVMRLPDAFVERHLWDLPELLTPHGRYPLEYDDAPSLTRTPHSKTASRELLESRTTTARRELFGRRRLPESAQTFFRCHDESEGRAREQQVRRPDLRPRVRRPGAAVRGGGPRRPFEGQDPARQVVSLFSFSYWAIRLTRVCCVTGTGTATTTK